MDLILNEWKRAIRGITSRPGGALLAILTLALGVGATTALYSVVHGVLLRPLGFVQEERLYAVLAQPGRSVQSPGNALPDYWFLRDHQSSFADLTFYTWHSMTLEEPGHLGQLRGLYVGENLFRLLGIKPLVGRVFTPEDAVPGRGRVTVLSHDLWQRLFDGDPGAVGRPLKVDGELLTIIGVMPAGIEVPSPRADLWVPVGRLEDPHGRFSRDERDFIFFGHLLPETSPEAAETELAGLAERLVEAFPETHQDWGLALTPLRDHLTGQKGGAILLAFGAVALVLLIACFNIAHLLLVRSAARQREMAVRAALGAGRRQLVRQLLVESLVLAALGGGLGTLAASWLLDAFLALDPGVLPRTHAVALDRPVLGFALLLTLVCGLACGLVPALRSSAVYFDALKAGGRTAGRTHKARWRVWLLGAEMALALVLLTAAGLLGRAFLELERVDPGFVAENVYSSHIILDEGRYLPLENRRRYFERLLEKVASIPGIEAVSLSTASPLPDLGIAIDVPYRGMEDPPLSVIMASAGGAPQAALRVISPGYLETVGIPLLRGRDVSARDTEEMPPVALVNHTLARRLWGEEGDPVGRSLEIFFGEDLRYEVVGVVGDTRFAGRHVPPRPAVFLAYPQMPFMGIAVVARSRLAPAVYEESLRRAVLQLDPLQPINGVWSLERELSRSLGTERFFAAVLGLFAVLALLLAAAGIYAVFSYWVSQRTREIAVRMAVGARVGQVMGMVVGEGLRVTLVGLGAGLLGALASADLLGRTFRGVASMPAGLMVTVAAALAAVALLACYLPARRASRIEPNVALRGD